MNIKKHLGTWTTGYSLDNHTISSKYLGDNNGHAQFETLRTDIGEALYQLKYNYDQSKVNYISDIMSNVINKNYPKIDLIIPMPPSHSRSIQPVVEITKKLSSLLNVPYDNSLLSKTPTNVQIKDLDTRTEKINALKGTLQLTKEINIMHNNVLIVDDLFDSGASLSVVTDILIKNKNIGNLHIITATRKRT